MLVSPAAGPVSSILSFTLPACIVGPRCIVRVSRPGEFVSSVSRYARKRALQHQDTIEAGLKFPAAAEKAVG
jgi:hypothetical protein